MQYETSLSWKKTKKLFFLWGNRENIYSSGFAFTLPNLEELTSGSHIYTHTLINPVHTCDLECDSVANLEQFVMMTLSFCDPIAIRSSNSIIWNFWQIASASTIFRHLRLRLEDFLIMQTNQIYFDNPRVSLVVLGGFLDNVNKTKKKKELLSNRLCHLVVWTYQRLKIQIRHRIALELRSSHVQIASVNRAKGTLQSCYRFYIFTFWCWFLISPPAAHPLLKSAN